MVCPRSHPSGKERVLRTLSRPGGGGRTPPFPPWGVRPQITSRPISVPPVEQNPPKKMPRKRTKFWHLSQLIGSVKRVAFNVSTHLLIIFFVGMFSSSDTFTWRYHVTLIWLFEIWAGINPLPNHQTDSISTQFQFLTLNLSCCADHWMRNQKASWWPIHKKKIELELRFALILMCPLHGIELVMVLVVLVTGTSSHNPSNHLQRCFIGRNFCSLTSDDCSNVPLASVFHPSLS